MCVRISIKKRYGKSTAHSICHTIILLTSAVSVSIVSTLLELLIDQKSMNTFYSKWSKTKTGQSHSHQFRTTFQLIYLSNDDFK